METPLLTMAEHVAQAARDFQQQRTGHVPKAVTVVLSMHHDISTVTGEEIVVFTLAKAPDVREAK